MNKLFFSFLFLFLSFSHNTFAQQWKRNRLEYTAGLGISNFLGDLGGADRIGTNGLRDLEISLTRPSVLGGVRYHLLKDLRVKGQFTYIRLNGNDALTKEPARNFRNLRFRSPVIELTAVGEYYLMQEKSGHLFKLRGVKGRKGFKWNIYATAGLGVFWFNPKGPLNGKWYALQPLQTENVRYSRINVAIPFGFGVRHTIDKQWSVNFELIMRKTFTDYIDDVSTDYQDYNTILQERGLVAAYFSDPGGQGKHPWTQAGEQRGDPSDKDAYISAIISVNYKLLHRRRNLPKF
ncbi:MAG: hypothetical protein HUU48_01835 [Flavobacteriales bacterium]|nr:hypothetical protein [Flavobacteriales bacterium]